MSKIQDEKIVKAVSEKSDKAKKVEKVDKIQKSETEKTVSKKSDKVKEVKEMKSTFKELSDLTIKDIEKFGKVPVVLKKVYYKKSKTTRFEIHVKFHEFLTIKKTFLNDSEYFLIALGLNLDQKKAEHTLRIPVRFITGINKNGNQYHQIELVFDKEKEIYYGDLWLHGSDLKLFKQLMSTVEFLERNEILDNADTENLYYQE